MFKQLMNEAMLTLTISPAGPVLIKASEGAGADPTHPDMEFVRTNQQIYLPGSSLKGVVRAHAERIVRALQAGQSDGRGACDPLDRSQACGARMGRRRSADRRDKQELSSAQKYVQSCCICRLFGNTVLASHVRFTDALPTGELRMEQRNGVAIDRVFGSAYGGALFNYEVVTQATFSTTIYLRNFTLAQLALLGLTLRDLDEGRVGLGFGKSRGMGSVKLGWQRLELRYPLAGMRAPQGNLAGLLGVGALLAPAQASAYRLAPDDRLPLPQALRAADDGWGSLRVAADGSEQITAIFRAATARWSQEVNRA